MCLPTAREPRPNVNNNDRSYSRLLRQVAGTGYVIIATQDAPTAFCANMYKDQLKSIDVAKRFPNVDASKGFGIFGHSMGGQSTVNSAGSRSHDIRAAVALHPATFGGGTVKVPILYATGSSDRMTGCSPRAVEDQQVILGISYWPVWPKSSQTCKGLEEK